MRLRRAIGRRPGVAGGLRVGLLPVFLRYAGGAQGFAHTARAIAAPYQ